MRDGLIHSADSPNWCTVDLFRSSCTRAPDPSAGFWSVSNSSSRVFSRRPAPRSSARRWSAHQLISSIAGEDIVAEGPVEQNGSRMRDFLGLSAFWLSGDFLGLIEG